MAFKRSAVRSRLSPPSIEEIVITENLGISMVPRFFVVFKRLRGMYAKDRRVEFVWNSQADVPSASRFGQFFSRSSAPKKVTMLRMPLYKKMVDVLIKSENNEAVNEGSAAIQQWVRTNTDNEASGYHEDVIIELARMVYLSGAKYLYPYNYLNILVINAIEKRKPGFLQECFNTTQQQMDYDIQQNGSVDCNESSQNKDE